MTSETRFLGGRKARIWTYLIFMVLLVVAAIGFNFALNDPETAKRGLDAFLGLPSWVFPVLAGLLGVGLFAMGLSIEADWPEALGALLIAGAVAAGEVMLGWERFAVGGIAVVPYVIPVLILAILLMVGLSRSR